MKFTFYACLMAGWIVGSVYPWKWSGVVLISGVLTAVILLDVMVYRYNLSRPKFDYDEDDDEKEEDRSTQDRPGTS